MSDVKQAMLERVNNGDIQFALDSPKAVTRQSGGSSGQPQPQDAPQNDIREHRAIADQDPHIAEAIHTLVDYLVGSGFFVTPANIPYTDQEQTNEDIADFKLLVEQSTLNTEIYSWVWHALVDGTGFLEIVVEDDVFKPKLLPTQNMEIQKNDKGRTIGYRLESEGSGQFIEYDKYEVAELKFHEHPTDDFGHSLIERCREQADYLRDMEIDLSRFISTKAYPPVMWKLGSEERPWSKDQINEWLDTVENIEPDSMLAVGHDVEHEVVGTTSTSSSAGMLKLDSTFRHLHKRIAAGLGVPAFLLNMDLDVSRNSKVGLMPKFDRRVQRYRSIIKQALRYQVFVSILGGDNPEEYNELPPGLEFGEHSSDEERLEIDAQIKLFNQGFLTREAFAERVGIDPEKELPDDGELDEITNIIQQLQGAGDNIQNPDGGSPTDTGGGAPSAGQEVDIRDNPENEDSDEQRPQSDVTNE